MHGSWLSLILMLLLVGLTLAGVTAWLMAIILLKPPRMTDGKAAWVLKRLSPGDLGLPFEEATFSVRGELTGEPLQIAGWWIPHPKSSGRCVVLIHGYADAKVGAIAWAPTFHALGCNVFAIDLRAHGESSGTYSTAGFFERHDVTAVIDRLHAERPEATRQIVLFGVSLGAAVAAAVAAEHTSLAGVILECPFPDYWAAASAHARLLGAPGRLMQRLAYWLAQWISSADFSAVRPVEMIARVTCPLMVIQSDADLMLDAADFAPIESAARARPAGAGELVYWRAANSHHLAAIYEDPADYQRRIKDFLAIAFKRKDGEGMGGTAHATVSPAEAINPPAEGSRRDG